MRSDAKQNRDRLLSAARSAVTELGAEVSLRDVARRAGVGMGTLYRHFPSREALLETLLRAGFDGLADRATALGTADRPGEALMIWLREAVAAAHEYKGAIDAMVAAIADPGSPLHSSCQAMKAAGGELLNRAQNAGEARSDIDGSDLFAVLAALTWLRDQPAFAARQDIHFDLMGGALLARAKTP